MYGMVDFLQQAHALELEQVDTHKRKTADNAERTDDDAGERKTQARGCLLASHDAQHDGNDAGDDTQDPGLGAGFCVS